MFLRRIIVVFAVGVLLLGPLIGGLLYQGYLRFNYPSIYGYTVFGIDVSHHQGEIDWGVLQKERLTFAWIKATEGKDFRDTRFDDNWRLAKAVGIKRGAYHFFTFCTPGVDQAANYIDRVKNADLPPAVDVEFGGNCRNRPNNETIKSELAALLKALEKHYGRKPVIYTTDQAWHSLIREEFTEYPLWIRSVVHPPNEIRYKNWLFWQYSARGHLEGISGLVDLNVFSGSHNQFQALLNADP